MGFGDVAILESQLAQDADRHDPVDREILHQEDPRVFPDTTRTHGGAAGGLAEPGGSHGRRFPKSSGEPEGRPDPLLALESDFAAQQSDESLRNGQEGALGLVRKDLALPWTTHATNSLTMAKSTAPAAEAKGSPSRSQTLPKNVATPVNHVAKQTGVRNRAAAQTSGVIRIARKTGPMIAQRRIIIRLWLAESSPK
jgi:hypothetical protein